MSALRARVLVGLVVLAQALVLAWMAAEREWIVRTGQVVFLRTAPVDPRDPFRGDFVRLEYEINAVTFDDGPPATDGRGRRRGEVVYTRLAPAGDGVYEGAGTSRAAPSEGVFIRGRTDDRWAWAGPIRPASVPVRYGIEQLYVEQGAGQEIEQRRGARDFLQVPMEVEVAISASGTAVIRGYRWSRLGTKLEITRQAARQPRNPLPRGPAVPDPTLPLSPAVRVTLVNTSDAPLAVADTEDHCAFTLTLVGWSEKAYPAADRTCAAGSAPRMTTLGPGETYVVDIDFAAPRWHVLNDGIATEIGALPAGTQFRLEYQVPSGATATPALWRGRLPTARFAANGVID